MPIFWLSSLFLPDQVREKGDVLSPRRWVSRSLVLLRGFFCAQFFARLPPISYDGDIIFRTSQPSIEDAIPLRLKKSNLWQVRHKMWSTRGVTQHIAYTFENA